MATGDTRVNLVCLPFGGAGASFYHPWSALAGDDLRVVPLQLPGRERRIDEEPFHDVQAATTALLADVRAVLHGGGRVALFGHSVGAVLAYELAHRLDSAPEFDVLRLFVSGAADPATGLSSNATGLPDEEFLAKVNELTGYRHEALDDPEMRELLLPALRGDMAMHETYVPTTTVLGVPVTALRGEHDSQVGRAQAAAWAGFTNRDFRLVELPGEHMYIAESAPELVRVIVAQLAEPGLT